jgi:hypothetical protein
VKIQWTFDKLRIYVLSCKAEARKNVEKVDLRDYAEHNCWGLE